MARVYLRSSPARRLRVEVDYVEGRAPSARALDHLASILRREAAKPDGVAVVRGEEIPKERNEYTLDDVRGLERRYRDARSAGATATIWVAYLNGDFVQQRGALGVAYSASAAAIFADQVDGAATSLVRPIAIERAVLTHEIGHILALVNIGYTSEHDHEDPEHPGHSSNEDSVMYWAIEDVSIASLLTGGPPDDFDQFDRDDLRMLRSG